MNVESKGVLACLFFTTPVSCVSASLRLIFTTRVFRVSLHLFLHTTRVFRVSKSREERGEWREQNGGGLLQPAAESSELISRRARCKRQSIAFASSSSIPRGKEVSNLWAQLSRPLWTLSCMVAALDNLPWNHAKCRVTHVRSSCHLEHRRLAGELRQRIHSSGAQEVVSTFV